MVTYSCFVNRMLARLAQLMQLHTGSELEVPNCPLDPNAACRISILVAELETVRFELLLFTHDRNKHAKKSVSILLTTKSEARSHAQRWTVTLFRTMQHMPKPYRSGHSLLCEDQRCSLLSPKLTVDTGHRDLFQSMASHVSQCLCQPAKCQTIMFPLQCVMPLSLACSIAKRSCAQCTGKNR